MATKQRCPKCNELNDLGVASCARCGSPLIQTCPICATPRPWYIERCPACQVRVDDSQLFTSLFRETPSEQLQGRYILRETIHVSPVSRVYRAVDVDDPSSTFAIKELSPIALIRAEERRQAESALYSLLERWARVRHPSLPEIVDSFERGDRHYVVFRFVQGWTGSSIIANRIPVTPDLARNWGAQICAALSVLHAQNPPLFVPFLAPDHLVVTASGEAHLVGLGLSYLFNPTAASPYGSVRGYAAPELEQAPPTVASDLFALGRLLYALLIGHPLERGLPRQMPLSRAVPGISSQLASAIARAAHRDPNRRYGSAKDLGDILWGTSGGEVRPIPDWRSVPTPSDPERLTETPRGIERTPQTASMADLGFQRDPRFGPERLQPMEEMRSAPQGEAHLSVYPNHFNLPDLQSDEVKRVVLSLRNRGSAELVGRIVSHVPWMSAPHKPVVLPAGKTAKAVLSVRAALVPSGHSVEPQALSVESNAGRQWVGVTVDVPSGPELRVDTPLLDFGAFDEAAPRSLELRLTNGGRQTLSGQIEARVPWLRLEHPQFRCRPGGQHSTRVELLPQRLPRGQHVEADALAIASDGGQATVAAKAWLKRAELDLGTTHMDFGALASGELAERYLYLSNTGDGDLVGTIRSLLPWLQAYPTEFRCEPGEMAQLAITLDSAGLADGRLHVPQALRVQTNAGVQTLSLHAEIRAPRLEVKTSLLDFGTAPRGGLREARLVITNEGSAPLEAHLQPLAPWLSLSETAIHCQPGEQLAVTARANTDLFEHGGHIDLAAGIRIVTGSTLCDLPVRISMLQPALTIDPERIDFGYVDQASPERRILTLSNEGTGDLAWNVQVDAVWVEIEPASGVCKTGEAQTLELTAYGLALDVQTRGTVSEANLVINSDGGRAKVPLRVGLAAPLIAVDAATVDMVSVNGASAQATLRIFNHGLGLLRGTVLTDQTWLALDRASFTCPTGRSVELRLSADMEELPHSSERAEGVVSIASNGGDIEIVVALSLERTPWIEAPGEIALEPSGSDAPLQGRLLLKNTGMANAHVELEASPRITLARYLCDIKPQKSARIAVSADSDATPGTEAGRIQVHAGDQELVVQVIVKG